MLGDALFADLPVGGRGDAATALARITDILGRDQCQNRLIQYRLDHKIDVSRGDFLEWVNESEEEGFTEINWSVDHRGDGPVVVSAWATEPLKQLPNEEL